MANKFSQRTLEWAIIICFYLNIAIGVGFFEASKWILSNDTQALWQYGLWSFQTGGTKLERFLPKNQHTQRIILNFENWTNGRV